MEYNVYLCRRKTVARQLKQASLRSLCTFFAYRNTLNMANRELNRLKVVLAEKKGQTAGWQNNLEKTKLPYLNGVLIQVNQTWQV